MRRALLAVATLSVAAAAAAVAPPLPAQGTFRIVVDSVTESRSREASNETAGRLTLMPKLDGDGLEEARAFRIRVAAAADDTGKDLLPEEPAPARWEENADGEGLWIRLASPARSAATVTVSGTVDLWAPQRDAGAEVKVPKALGRPGKPFSSAGLRSAGVALGLAPRDATPEGTISITGREPDLEKVRSIRVLASDGSEIETKGRRTGVVDGKETIEILLSGPAPGDATLVFGLLTKKSTLSVPFELKEVPLP